MQQPKAALTARLQRVPTLPFPSDRGLAALPEGLHGTATRAGAAGAQCWQLDATHSAWRRAKACLISSRCFLFLVCVNTNEMQLLHSVLGWLSCAACLAVHLWEILALSYLYIFIRVRVVFSLVPYEMNIIILLVVQNFFLILSLVV